MGIYTPIITDVGNQLILDSIAHGTTITLKSFAWGDGSGYPVTPNPTQTSLVNEVYRQDVTAVAIDPLVSTWLDIVTLVPGTVGGFWIREVGIFTDQNVLFAVASHPEAYKSLPTDGTAIDFSEKLILEIANLTEVVIHLDPSVNFVTFPQLIAHKHDGGGQSPTKINLTLGAEVQGNLPLSMIAIDGDFNLSNHKITNLSNPVLNTDGVNRAYIDTFKVGKAPSGLTALNNISSVTTLDIQPGRTLDSSLSKSITLSTTLSKDLGATWIEGGLGGLPPVLSPVLPNTTYHVFVIMRSDGVTVDAGYDISLTASNLLGIASGYSYYKRIMSITTDGSGNIIPYSISEYNDGSVECFYTPTLLSINNSSPPSVLTDALVNTPSGLAVKTNLYIEHKSIGTTESAVEIHSKQNLVDLEICRLAADNTVARYASDNMYLYTNINKQIQYRITGTGNTETVKIYTVSYIDNRI